MPKVYYLNCPPYKEGLPEVEVFKCKGYPGDLTREDFVKLYNGETLDLVVTKWFKKPDDAKIFINRNLPYKLKVSFNKRTQIRDFEGVWVTTQPLRLNDPY
jgi:hypothetical protein